MIPCHDSTWVKKINRDVRCFATSSPPSSVRPSLDRDRALHLSRELSRVQYRPTSSLMKDLWALNFNLSQFLNLTLKNSHGPRETDRGLLIPTSVESTVTSQLSPCSGLAHVPCFKLTTTSFKFTASTQSTSSLLHLSPGSSIQPGHRMPNPPTQ